VEERGSGSPPPSCTSWVPASTDRRLARPRAFPEIAHPRRRCLPGEGEDLDVWRDGRCHIARMPHLVPSLPCRPLVQGSALESARTWLPCPPPRRSRDRQVVRRDLPGPQQERQAHEHSIFFRDESEFYPLPSVVCAYAPVCLTLIPRE